MVKTVFAARDSLKPSAYFLKLSELEAKALRSDSRRKSTGVGILMTKRHLTMANAIYSAGIPVKACVTHLNSAAECLTTALHGSIERPILGIPSFDIYVEAASAAYLTGHLTEMESAFKRSQFKNIERWQHVALLGVFNAFSELPIPRAELTGADLEYQSLFRKLLQAVSKRHSTAFGPSLESYLGKEYGPVAERAARYQLKTKNSMYPGRWTFFAAACCHAMKQVPRISATCSHYLPIDILAPT
jgi:hypothetical protein